MPILMKLDGIEIEKRDTRVEVIFHCADEANAETLCDIIVDGIAAGSVKIGKFSMSGSPVVDESENGDD